MPRKSAEARATVSAAQIGRLAASRGLSAVERRAWRDLIAATPAGHLSERDRPLVESFVGLTVQQRKLAELVSGADATALADPRSPAGVASKRLEALAKTLCALSNRLKLAPLGGSKDAHKAKIRDEQPSRPAPLLGGIRRVV